MFFVYKPLPCIVNRHRFLLRLACTGYLYLSLVRESKTVQLKKTVFCTTVFVLSILTLGGNELL